MASSAGHPEEEPFERDLAIADLLVEPYQIQELVYLLLNQGYPLWRLQQAAARLSVILPPVWRQLLLDAVGVTEV